AEIDHVGPVSLHRKRQAQNLGVGQSPRVINLRQDLDVVTAQIGRRGRLAEILRQVVQVLRSSLERNGEVIDQAAEIPLTPTGQDHAVGSLYKRQLAGNPLHLHE